MSISYNIIYWVCITKKMGACGFLKTSAATVFTFRSKQIVDGVFVG